MNHEDYGFEDDYAEYERFEDAGTAQGQPKPQLKYKEIKKQREVH